MKISFAAIGTVLASLTGSVPVQAQQIVYDPTAYAQMIREAQTALDQLQALRAQVEQGEQLFDSLNTLSDVNAIASELGLPEIRNPAPALSAFAAASQGDLDALGALADRANQIRDQHRVLPQSEATSPADDAYRQALDRSGARAARDYATGEAVGLATEQRLAGLETLRRALDTAPNARAVLDLNARIAAEQAQIQNEQTRLQSLEMLREAEDRLAQQQMRERAQAAHQARLKLYESAFQ